LVSNELHSTFVTGEERRGEQRTEKGESNAGG